MPRDHAHLMKPSQPSELPYVNPGSPPSFLDRWGMLAFSSVILIALPALAIAEFVVEQELFAPDALPGAADPQLDLFTQLVRAVAVVAFLFIFVALPALFAFVGLQRFGAWFPERFDGQTLMLIRGNDRAEIDTNTIDHSQTNRFLDMRTITARGTRYRIDRAIALPDYVRAAVCPMPLTDRSAWRTYTLIAVTCALFILPVCGLLAWGHSIGVVERKAVVLFPLIAITCTCFYAFAAWKERQPRA